MFIKFSLYLILPIVALIGFYYGVIITGLLCAIFVFAFKGMWHEIAFITQQKIFVYVFRLHAIAALFIALPIRPSELDRTFVAVMCSGVLTIISFILIIIGFAKFKEIHKSSDFTES